MRRFLLALVLAAALLGVAAAPAGAGAPWAPQFRPTPNTAYVIAYYDGSWFEVVGEGEAAYVVPHFSVRDEATFELLVPPDPVPGDYDIVMQLGWKNASYGLVKTLPLAFEPKVSIFDEGGNPIVDMSYEDAKAYWIGVSLWDEWWVTNLGEMPTFNLHMGTQIYANRWFPQLTGDEGIAANLTAEKKLPPGTYTVDYAERFVRTYTGLEESFVLVEDEWVRLKTPYHAKPSGENSTSFTFTVAPPAP